MRLQVEEGLSLNSQMLRELDMVNNYAIYYVKSELKEVKFMIVSKFHSPTYNSHEENT